MSTLTQIEQQKIVDWLATHELPSGLGTEESACSIASINLALTGRLTASIPGCMSPVIGRWVIGIQDAMPATLRNSVEWKRLLPLAAGTGRDSEVCRLDLILDWMWTRVLPELTPIAERGGYGPAWQTMLAEESSAAADAAYAAAYAAAAAAAYAAADAAAYAADAAAYAAADAADAAAAAYAANAANAAAYAAAYAKKSARDKSLADYAEAVVQILIEMKAPGCQWLELTEAA